MISIRKISFLCLIGCLFAISCSNSKEITADEAKSFITSKYDGKEPKQIKKISFLYDASESKGDTARSEANSSLKEMAESQGVNYVDNSLKLSFENTDNLGTARIITVDLIDSSIDQFGNDNVHFYTSGNELILKANYEDTSTKTNYIFEQKVNSDGILYTDYSKQSQVTGDNTYVLASTSTFYF